MKIGYLDECPIFLQQVFFLLCAIFPDRLLTSNNKMQPIIGNLLFFQY